MTLDERYKVTRMAEQYQLLPDLTDEEFAALKDDIAERGVQVPVEVDERGNVLDGHHRLRACAELGIVDWPSIVRVGFTEEEKTAHVLALNLARRHLDGEQRKVLFARLREQGWSLRRIAGATNVSHETVRQDLNCQEVDNLPGRIERTGGGTYPARRPAVYSPTPKQTERTLDNLQTVTPQGPMSADELEGVVTKARREEQRAEAAARAPVPLPIGVFNVVYADPPWEYANSGLAGSAADHYPTMSTDKLCDLPLAEHLADNAVLFLWVTNPLLVDGLAVMAAWGFDYKTNFVWVKNRETYGKLGFYVYGRHELLMVGVRGSCLPAEDGKVASVLEYAKREHSRKPEEVYTIIEGMYPAGVYLELFARQERAGWTAWGNEVGKWK